MSAQHTPGPWVYDSFGHTSFAFNDNREDYSARIEWAPDMSDEEVDANARLISIAPDLLTALEALASRMSENADGRELYGDWIAIAEEAINKAKGGAK